MRTRKTDYLLTGAIALLPMTGCSDAGPQPVVPPKVDIQTRYNSGPGKLFVNGRHASRAQVNGGLLGARLAGGRQVAGKFENNVLNGELVSLVFTDTGAGTTYKGAELVGAELTGYLPDGSTQALRFAAYDATTVPSTNLYLVNYVDSGESVCGVRDGQPIWAALLPQQYDESTGNERTADPNRFTFSCRFGAIQMCQEMGYPKNGTARERKNGVDKIRSLNDYHSACVRMMRADYCGNGLSHTFEGTRVDLYDHLLNGNVAATGTTGQDGFYFESEWDVDGAHCLSATRWMPAMLDSLTMNQSSANPDWEYARLNCPQRFAYPVLMVNGGFSVPDRACGSSSKWNTSVGYDQYAESAPTQPGRNKLRTNVMLNKYTD